MNRLHDRVAIVTGSGGGLGFAIAGALANDGARVAIADINKDAVESAADRLTQERLEAVGVVTDVTDKASVAKTFNEIISRWGGIDILVNNAGGALHTPHLLSEIEEKDWDLVVDVNLKGTFLCCQKAIESMAAKGTGVIVNISALAAHYRASLAGVQYTAAKAGIEGLTRQLAYDWGPKGIRVVAVAPTVTMTGERVRGLWENKSDEERRRTLDQIPLRRLSEPREIAACVVFLASDEASFVTGITLDVSGGRYLR
jgi:NAD(P)-dependent dehydrogenase (short-subunit alcohol dehydrogenase family)